MLLTPLVLSHPLTMTMGLLSSPSAPSHLPTVSPSSSSSKPHLPVHKLFFHLPSKSKRTHLSILLKKATTDNGAGIDASSIAAVVSDEKILESSSTNISASQLEKSDEAFGNPVDAAVKKFEDLRWTNGTWDLDRFRLDGKTDWDAVIDAEARRRKWLELNPESSSNDEPVVFDTSIIPWWAWVKKFHLPEAEILNGRAAMIGFFMAYFVDSLTGLGVVDQMSNFFCKALLFTSVAGVLLLRKNEDVQNLKKLIEELTFYDKQWQATWQDDTLKKD